MKSKPIGEGGKKPVDSVGRGAGTKAPKTPGKPGVMVTSTGTKVVKELKANLRKAKRSVCKQRERIEEYGQVMFLISQHIKGKVVLQKSKNIEGNEDFV